MNALPLAAWGVVLSASASLAGPAASVSRGLSFAQPHVAAPEPAAITLSGMGLAGVGWYFTSRSRRRLRSEAALQTVKTGTHPFRAAIIAIVDAIDQYVYLLVKRLADIALAGVAVVILSPFLLLIAAAIYRETPGPVLFSHERLGQRRRKFRLYKFRSMCMNADKMLKDLLDSHEELRKEFEQFYKLKNDPRITRIGAFLRRTSMDELPQLINVLKGEMSLVGPRPIVEAESEKYWPHEEQLFSVRPGVTGLWQVSGRNDTSYDERVRLDMVYIRDRTLLMDARILISTLPALIRRHGAY